jgi:hypothetical protein
MGMLLARAAIAWTINRGILPRGGAAGSAAIPLQSPVAARERTRAKTAGRRGLMRAVG